MQYIRFDENYGNYKLIPVTDLPQKHIKNPKSPHFISMMKYNHQQFLEWQKTKSLKGMKGGTTNKLWADFDSKDIRLALADCKVFVDRLRELGFADNEIQISFSGNKGTGVIVETTQDYTLEQVTAFVTNLAKGLKTFDTSMYDHQRIFRLLFTKNEKTGSYKIPLEYTDLDLEPAQIFEMAKSLDEYDQDAVFSYYQKSNVVIPSNLMEVQKKETKKTELVKSEHRPKGWKEYAWQIQQGNFEKGERHSALMVLAARHRGMGYDAETAIAMCNAADKKHCKRTNDSPVDDLEDNIIPTVYSSTWRGGQFSPETNVWLKGYCERLGIDTESEEVNIVKIGDVRTDFVDYMQNIEANTVKTGIPCLDEAMPLTTGMICGVLGAASSGKTALALKMLENTSKNGVLSVFASLDMHRTRLFHKLVMRETDFDRKELIGEVKAGRAADIFETIQQKFENVYFYDRSAASVDQIRNYIERVQEATGQKVKFLMIDYFERLGSERSDDTAASKEVAGALQDLCNDLNLCIVVLVQPNKFALGGGPDSPLLSYASIKGSSFLYQAFRSIISIWRPFFTPDLKEHDRFLEMAILKNDLGELDKFQFGWSGKKGDIWECSEEERDDLERLLKQKQDDKNAESGDDWS